MVKYANELHKIVQPKHKTIMIKNRGCSPDDPEFYNHIHPIEDLLAYMENPHVNDDPIDHSLNQEFSMKIYSRRWGHDDIYKIKKTSTGWNISHPPMDGDCDKLAQPKLYEILDHDSINYPEELPGYMEWLWNVAAEDGLSIDEVQSALNELSDWINICEKNSPRGIFGGYK